MPRLLASFIVFLIWGVVTMFGVKLYAAPNRSMFDVISEGVAWNILAAAVFVFLAARFLRWRDLALGAPKPLASVKLVWFPLLFLAVLFALALAKGLPPPRALQFIFLNTAIVGVSEELMCRGVLFQGLRSSLKLWPSIVIVSLLFGALHVLNAFGTGRLVFASVQAVAAAMTGFMLIALRVRTGSLWVPIAVHGLWDFCTISLAGKAPDAAAIDQIPLWLVVLAPLCLATPNFVYAVFLLRRITNATRLANE
jgi:membrane protease YdiL (CAAX protease family)